MNIIDVIIIAIVVFAALLSAKKGFVKVFVEIIGSVAAMYVSYILSTPIAKFISTKFIEPGISKKIAESLSDTVGNVSDAIPSFVKKASTLFGVNISTADGFSGTSEQITAKVMSDIVSPVLISFLKVIVLIVLIIALLFVVKIVAKVLNKLFSFSLVGKLNKTLGFIFGIIKGVVIAVLFCLIISFFVSLTENGFLIFTKEALENSSLFTGFTDLLPNIIKF